MSVENKNQTISNFINQVEEGSATNNPISEDVPSIDTQVKIKRKYAPRRSYETSYKQRMVAAYDACESSSERGALLRKEGLYHARISDWKNEFEKSSLTMKNKKHTKTRIDHLANENEQLKKKLAHAEAIIEIQKKISDLLGTHILPAEKIVLK